MKTSLYERTEYQIVFDLHYGQRSCLLASRFYGRIAWIFSIITIFCGSAAFAGWYAGDPNLSLYPSLLLSLIAAINLTWKPSEKRLFCELERQKWNTLIKEASGLSADQVDERINTLRSVDSPEIEYLRDVAFNDVLQEQGQKEGFVDLGLMNKACAFIAA